MSGGRAKPPAPLAGDLGEVASNLQASVAVGSGHSAEAAGGAAAQQGRSVHFSEAGSAVTQGMRRLHSLSAQDNSRDRRKPPAGYAKSLSSKVARGAAKSKTPLHKASKSPAPGRSRAKQPAREQAEEEAADEEDDELEGQQSDDSWGRSNARHEEDMQQQEHMDYADDESDEEAPQRKKARGGGRGGAGGGARAGGRGGVPVKASQAKVVSSSSRKATSDGLSSRGGRGGRGTGPPAPS